MACPLRSHFKAVTRGARAPGSSTLLVWAGLAGCSSFNAVDTTQQVDSGRASPPSEACNHVDDNGNGQVDEGCSCDTGSSQRCFVGDPSRAGKGNCQWGLQVCMGKGAQGHWGQCSGYGMDTSCQASVADAGSASAGSLCPVTSNGKQLSWKQVPYDGPAGPSLRGVWGSGPSDVWAVGSQGLIVHWNGSVWSRVSIPQSPNLNSVWGSGPKDVWAVGENGVILHWNGSAWSDIANGIKAPGHLYDVWGSGPSDVWAVGGRWGLLDLTKTPDLSASVILHWNGSTWSEISTNIVAGLQAIWGTGPSDVWIAGGAPAADISETHVPTGIWHWEGSSWSPVLAYEVKSKQYASYIGNYDDLWASGPSDVWAITFDGYLARRNDSGWALDDQLTSSLKIAGILGSPGTTSLWGSGPHSVWFTMSTLSNGLESISHWDGSSWTVCAPNRRTWYLNDLWGSGPSDIWAVGQTMTDPKTHSPNTGATGFNVSVGTDAGSQNTDPNAVPLILRYH